MRTIRLLLKLFRAFAVLFTLWTAVKRSRWWAAALAVRRMLRRQPLRDTEKMAQFTVATAGEAGLYRREGWRRPLPRKLVMRKMKG